MQDYLVLEGDSTLWNRTTGMCGSLTSNPFDDFMSRDREKVKNLQDFASAWTIKDGELSHN